MSSRSGQSKASRGPSNPQHRGRTLAFNDSISNAQAFIDEEHNLIHDGLLYEFSAALQIVGGATVGVGIEDLEPSFPMHAVFRVGPGGLIGADYVFRIYDAAITEPGAPVNGVAHNRSLKDPAPPNKLFDPAATLTSGNLLFEKVLHGGRKFHSKEWIFDVINNPGDVWMEVQNLNLSTSFTMSINITYYAHKNMGVSISPIL